MWHISLNSITKWQTILSSSNGGGIHPLQTISVQIQSISVFHPTCSVWTIFFYVRLLFNNHLNTDPTGSHSIGPALSEESIILDIFLYFRYFWYFDNLDIFRYFLICTWCKQIICINQPHPVLLQPEWKALARRITQMLQKKETFPHLQICKDNFYSLSTDCTLPSIPVRCNVGWNFDPSKTNNYSSLPQATNFSSHWKVK